MDKVGMVRRTVSGMLAVCCTVLIICFGGCVKDGPGKVDCCQGNATVSLNLGDMISVKSEASSNERWILHAYVLVFDGTTEKYVKGERIEESGITGNGSQTPKIVTSMKIDNNSKVVVLCNTNVTYTTTAIPLTATSTIDDINERFVRSSVPLYDQYTLPYTGSDTGKGLPMSGMITSWTSTAVCKITRAVAKIRVVLGSDIAANDVTGRFTASNTELNWSLRTWHRTGDIFDTGDILSNNGDPYGSNGLWRRVVGSVGAKPEEQVLYAPEFPSSVRTYDGTAISNDTWDKGRDFIVLKIREGCYRIDLYDKTTKKYIDIKRNTDIVITINKVKVYPNFFSNDIYTGYGYMSNNLEYDISVTDNNSNETISNGQGYISLSNSEFVIYSNAAETIQVATLTYNVPKEAMPTEGIVISTEGALLPLYSTPLEYAEGQQTVELAVSMDAGCTTGTVQVGVGGNLYKRITVTRRNILQLNSGNDVVLSDFNDPKYTYAEFDDSKPKRVALGRSATDFVYGKSVTSPGGVYLKIEDRSNVRKCRFTVVNSDNCTRTRVLVRWTETNTSNSYIINPSVEPVLYIPMDKVNDFWSIANSSKTFKDTTTWTAELLWQDTPTSDFIRFIKDDGTLATTLSGRGLQSIAVTTKAGYEGNALVCVKNAEGEIMWSWHLWVTDYNPTYDAAPVAGQYVYPVSNGYVHRYAGAIWETGVMQNKYIMDRNLGARTAGFSTVGALFYQYGRKDPQPMIGNGNQLYDINGTSLNYTGNNRNLYNKPLSPEVIANNPTQFMYNGGSYGMNICYMTPNVDLGNIANPFFTNNPWCNPIPGNNLKSLFDPCPPGWKMPPQYEIWSDFVYNAKAYNGIADSLSTVNNGNRDPKLDWSYNGEDGVRYWPLGSTVAGAIYYPAIGFRYATTGQIYDLGTSAVISSASGGSNLGWVSGAQTFLLVRMLWGRKVIPAANAYSGLHGVSVRCVQE